MTVVVTLTTGVTSSVTVCAAVSRTTRRALIRSTCSGIKSYGIVVPLDGRTAPEVHFQGGSRWERVKGGGRALPPWCSRRAGLITLLPAAVTKQTQRSRGKLMIGRLVGLGFSVAVLAMAEAPRPVEAGHGVVRFRGSSRSYGGSGYGRGMSRSGTRSFGGRVPTWSFNLGGIGGNTFGRRSLSPYSFGPPTGGYWGGFVGRRDIHRFTTPRRSFTRWRGYGH